jgi:NAD(P)-dependent dehydrogenase (short-subunit alcohol dehydrogenase family)
MVASGGGTMVFIASVSGLSAAPMHAAYGAAKAGLMAYVQTLAVELAPHGIRANAVAPGTILTPRMDAIYTDEQRAANTAVIPLGRMGRPADIAGAALFLTSDLSSFVSGRTLVVDGAVDAKFPYGTL